MFFEGANFNIYEIPVFIFDILMIIFIHRWHKRDD